VTALSLEVSGHHDTSLHALGQRLVSKLHQNRRRVSRVSASGTCQSPRVYLRRSLRRANQCISTTVLWAVIPGPKEIEQWLARPDCDKPRSDPGKTMYSSVGIVPGRDAASNWLRSLSSRDLIEALVDGTAEALLVPAGCDRRIGGPVRVGSDPAPHPGEGERVGAHSGEVRLSRLSEGVS